MDGAQKAGLESRFRSGLAAGLAGFAGVLLLVVGAFQALQGLSAIVRDWLLVLTQDYIYRFDSTAWGWIHLLIGLSLAAVGAAILAGKVWGRVVGIGLAAMSAVTQFLWLPYFPVWAVLVIALDVGIIWRSRSTIRAPLGSYAAPLPTSRKPTESRGRLLCPLPVSLGR